MDVIRRNTDYAMRLMAGLTKNHTKQLVSARILAEEYAVSYDLTCKLLQKLSAAKLVKSTMGAGGGFELALPPEKISLFNIIEAIQGDICLNRCVPNPKSCPNSSTCGISKRLIDLQGYIDEYLKKITLGDL
ncbi:MAG: Rrf2 family transcriptional regulator [Phycisphaerales bacterium]